MASFEALLALVVALVLVSWLADRMALPAPVMLIGTGALFALVPGFPRLELEPEVLFALFVPPLVYAGAFEVSPRELLARWQPIVALAIALVLVTMGAIALLAHHMLGFPWAVAFVLGAILAPPDAVAVLETMRNLKLPRGITVILEGESLLNDAVALVAYKVAVAAAVTGAFSPLGTAVSLPLVVAGGVLIGGLVGAGTLAIRQRLASPTIESAFTLVVPYAAYFAADLVGASGILAALAAGIYSGWHVPMVSDAGSRLQVQPLWQTMVFLLGGLVFLLVGLETPVILHGLAGYRPAFLAGAAAAMVVLVVALRVAWVFGTAWMLQRGQPDPFPWREVGLVSWSGLRGVDTLVTALALPLVVAAGPPFPHRALITFLAFVIVLVTLAVQGISLPTLIKRWHLDETDETDEAELKARLAATRAALAGLDEFHGEGSRLTQDLRRSYEDRRSRYEQRLRRRQLADAGKEVEGYHALLDDLLERERDAIHRLRRHGEIGADLHQKLLHEVDLTAAQHQEHR
jgi:CPA1 family monovalent cation:H+ antiporter